jgi:hypothetical protein
VLPEVPQRAESPRDARPHDATSTPFSVPTPATFTLANGLNVMLWTRKDLPLVSMHLTHGNLRGLTLHLELTAHGRLRYEELRPRPAPAASCA